ncbi:nucleolar protein of 40 kDa-like [Haliotis rufescens]|uniref:nucleolar protein of 40 kDa-like n=1 Tax=Haliotis rufescens TaxID=6454 RepID=UPI001EAFA3D3|nr:nucleolar protein of 40 kDa-like [Haliotis rufescens]
MAKRGHDHDDERDHQYKRHRDDDGGDVPALYSIFHGEIASVQNYGAFVKIPGCRKQGLVHKSQMSRARVEDPSEMVSLRERVYCKVISIEGEHQKIGLSMKYVNQTTGQDLDSNNVQGSMDDRRRKQGFSSERPKIELGAIYDTKCARCGTRGHLSKECYAERGGKQYDLIPDLEKYVPDSQPPAQSPEKKKKKKERKHKKEKKNKKKKKHRHSSSSDESDRDAKRRRKSGQKKKKRHHSSDSSDS